MNNISIDEIRDILEKELNIEDVLTIPDSILQKIEKNIHNLYVEQNSVLEYRDFFINTFNQRVINYNNIFTTFKNLSKYHTNSIDIMRNRITILNDNIFKKLKSYTTFENKLSKEIESKSTIYVTAPFKSGKTAYIYQFLSSHSNDYYICLYSILTSEKLEFNEFIELDIFNEYTDKPLLLIFDSKDQQIIVTYKEFENIHIIIEERSSRITKNTFQEESHVYIESFKEDDIHFINQSPELTTYLDKYNYYFYNLLLKDSSFSGIGTFCSILEKVYIQITGKFNPYILDRNDLFYFINLSIADPYYDQLINRISKDYLKQQKKQNQNYVIIKEYLVNKLKTIKENNMEPNDKIKNTIINIYYILLLDFKYSNPINSNSNTLSSLKTYISEINWYLPDYIKFDDIVSDNSHIALFISYYLVNNAETINSLESLKREYSYLEKFDDIKIKKNYYDSIAICLQSIILTSKNSQQYLPVVKKEIENIKDKNVFKIQYIKLLIIEYQINEKEKEIIKTTIQDCLDTINHSESSNMSFIDSVNAIIN